MLSIKITLSTYFLNSIKPCSAFSLLTTPSELNGNVATATTNGIPISLAIFAITGAAPVPVPPPNPNKIHNISAPSNTCFIRFWLDLAASTPISGLPPAPNPLVTSLPNNIFLLALTIFK